MRSPALVLTFFLALPANLVFGITLGQVEDFTDGYSGWNGADGHEVVSSGGPSGAGDAYLRIWSIEPSGCLSASNGWGWAGDYLGAGVTSIEADLMNLGTSDLSLRLHFYGATRNGGGEFTSNAPYILPADGQWHHARFGLASSSLTRLSPSGTLAPALQSLSVFHIAHDDVTPSTSAPFYTHVLGSLGLDNILATPEPTSGLLVSASCALAVLRRKRT